MNKKILLHICCGTCTIYPLAALRDKKYDVEGVFFNPNIHPAKEFIERKQAVAQVAVKKDLSVYYLEYEPELYFDATKDKSEEDRCLSCWKLRLKETADFAKENDFDLFTTTLLVSPYQNIDRIKDIGEATSKEKGVEFYFEDFRKGFKAAKQESKDMKLYMQKYCGCKYSLQERYDRKDQG